MNSLLLIKNFTNAPSHNAETIPREAEEAKLFKKSGLIHTNVQTHGTDPNIATQRNA
jgi:hypothetical protein